MQQRDNAKSRKFLLELQTYLSGVVLFAASEEPQELERRVRVQFVMGGTMLLVTLGSSELGVRTPVVFLDQSTAGLVGHLHGMKVAAALGEIIGAMK